MREPIAKTPRTRPQRSKLSGKSRLVVHNKDENFEYRVVNDVRDRVEIFKENGWEVVPAADVKIGDKRVEDPSSVGSASRIAVGLVGEQAGHAVVMRIPKEWFKEDQAAKEQELRALEQTMKEDARNSADYGTVLLPRDNK